jgi:hypothetical protein
MIPGTLIAEIYRIYCLFHLVTDARTINNIFLLTERLWLLSAFQKQPHTEMRRISWCLLENYFTSPSGQGGILFKADSCFKIKKST